MSLPPFNWRLAYFISIGLRFVFALSNSYIHPDEHFQSLEVMTSRILGFSANIPWEFTSTTPARSLAPLYLIYGPIIYLIKFVGLQLSPLQIWYLIRLQNVVIGWIITDMCIYRILPTKPERMKAILFTLTSYITLVYQSHLFSNSIETYLLILAVMIIDNIRYIDESKDPRVKVISQKKELAWLGLVISLGIFNRITFPAFLLFPSWYLVKYLWKNKSSVIFLVSGFVSTSMAYIVIDTIGYTGSETILSDPFSYKTYVITPLNNLIYNSNYLNLAHHGIHPLYTHLFINIPQILGLSGIILVLYKLKNQYYLTVPFLSAASGIVVLSCFPHQELRFLIPIVPLLCCCFDMSKFTSQFSKKTTWINVLLYEWYAFNILMSILMGIFHQGGVVPALDHLHTSSTTNTFQVWWRTYSPPTWILGDKDSSTQVITLNDENFDAGYILDATKSTYIFDTMGSDHEKVEKLLEELLSINNQTILITPTASFNVKFDNSTTPYKQLWHYNYHIDMDHLDFSNLDSLKPGLGIYQLL